MAKHLEPPSFVSELKTYASYKADLELWSRITSLEKGKQAETVVYLLENDPSRIKEKILRQIPEKIKGEDGIKELLAFLDTIYQKDEMADTWDKYIEFSSLCKTLDQPMVDFISDWENVYHKAKAVGCEYSDIILAFKLLKDSNLQEMDIKLVLTGVDFAQGKDKKDLYNQVVSSLKKFKGRSVMMGSSKVENVDVKVEPTWFSEAENVFLAKGWKPPARGARRRSRSASPVRGGGGSNSYENSRSSSVQERQSSNYKGKKNRLGKDFKPLKCHFCKCKHVEPCTCPCVYHLQPDCPSKKGTLVQESKSNATKPNLAFYMQRNVWGDDSDEDELVLIVNESLSNLVLLSVSKFESIVDSACPNTVSGKSWLDDFISELDEEDRRKISYRESERIFKFGGGEKRKSLGIVTFPCLLAGRNVRMQTEVVEADFPLLLGNSMLKKANAILYLGEEKAVIMGNEVKMRETSSGHFSVLVETPCKGVSFVKLTPGTEVGVISSGDTEAFNEYCLMNGSTNELSLADVKKLHHQFGHSKKLLQLIKNSNKLTKEVHGYLEEVEENCKGCRLNAKSKPRPSVGLPRATGFNQIVTLDLKEYNNGRHKYILYMIDVFSRFLAALFISDKNPATVGAGILEKWLNTFGRMNTLHSDRGGEFCSQELADIADYLGVRSTFTAAYSPNQNGLNERNHAVCDRMMDKMLTEEPALSPNIALMWAVLAKNTLENVSGYSPFQIVFGEQPRLPSVYTSGPPGLEEVVMNKKVADNINAMHLSRKAYIECESDRVLKQALKQRIYQRGDDIDIGHWIYFCNKPSKGRSKWEGPVKVVGKDKKTLYVVRGGKLLSINSDHAQISRFEGEIRKEEKKLSERKEADKKEMRFYEEVETTEDTSVNQEELSQEAANGSLTSNNEPSKENVDQTEDSKKKSEMIKIKKSDVVRYKEEADGEWIKREIVSRAGKVGGLYEKWWNVKDCDTGHIKSEDLGTKICLEKVEEAVEEVEKEEEVYVVTIPRYRHHEYQCKVAKEKELSQWDEFKVYEEVRDDGQYKLNTNWVLTEKIISGKGGVKARLTIRGDQENTDEIRKDSPTVRKGNIKVFVTIAAKEKWEIFSSDVTCAFLQGMEITCDVYVLPPKERRVPGVIWKLLKPVYGLADAPRGWYLALDQQMRAMGCENCAYDPAMYLNYQISSKSGKKMIEGIAVTHVDDILHGGNDEFQAAMEELKSKFIFGLDEVQEFRYVGMNLSRTSKGITVDQDHYINTFEVPDMEVASGQLMSDLLNAEGQTLFRGHVSRVLHIGYLSRPDVLFEAKVLSTKFGKATKGDLKSVQKKIQKLQGIPTKMFFPDLGPTDEWIFVGYGDAGIKSMPDKVSSVGGQVVLLANPGRSVACVLSWKSKKLVRKVVSSLAGEALAVVAAIGEIVYTKSIIHQIYGDIIEKTPVIIVTDSKNLDEAVHSSSLVEDAWLITDVAIIKDALQDGTISCLKRVQSEAMLANCLTKAGASAEQLLEVVQTGRYSVPTGVGITQ